MQTAGFRLAGPGFCPPKAPQPPAVKKRGRRLPYVSAAVLSLLFLGCIFAELLMNHDPLYLDLSHLSEPPGREFYFGTDPMGRDIFSMIWYGGRISLFIGLVSAGVSTLIAVVYGCVSGVAPEAVDDLLMRFTEIILSIPSILIVIFLQAFLGQSDPLSIALVIGITSWMNIAKVVRSEVRQIRQSGFVTASKAMGGGFFHVLSRHLFPNFLPAIMFMIVTNIGSAIGTESTLSFLGIGLPVETVSWGSMLSQADRALLSNSWWVILAPGVFLAVSLVCITNIGNSIRKSGNRKCSNL